MNVNFGIQNNHYKAQSAVKFTPVHKDFVQSLTAKAMTPAVSSTANTAPQIGHIVSDTREQYEERKAAVLSSSRGHNMTAEERAADLEAFKAVKRLTPEEQSQLKDGTHYGVTIGAGNLPAFIKYLEEAAANGESLVSAITHWDLNHRTGWANSDWVDMAEGTAHSVFYVNTFTGEVSPAYSRYMYPYGTECVHTTGKTAAEKQQIYDAAHNAVMVHEPAVPQMTRDINSFILKTFFSQGGSSSVFDDVLNMGGAI
jgi:hypothetical protein